MGDATVHVILKRVFSFITFFKELSFVFKCSQRSRATNNLLIIKHWDQPMKSIWLDWIQRQPDDATTSDVNEDFLTKLIERRS